MSSRTHHEDTILSKENFPISDLKQEMLKLPIFQDKKSLNILENELEHSKNGGEGMTSKDQKENLTVSKKKAEFEKRIKRFI
jgi:hypothetical protein